MSTVRSKTARIISELWANDNPDKGALATLRVTHNINDPRASKVWPYIFHEFEKEDLSRTGKPTYTENAVYSALQCYAIYQQSNDQYLFGKTKVFNMLGKIRQNEDLQNGLDRRAQIVFTNTNYTTVTKTIIQLIRIAKSNSATTPLDFGQLAQDLYYCQFNRNLAHKITLKWGEQYYWINHELPNED